MTLHEKVNITTGVGWMNGLCVGSIGKIGDFPGLCLEDSPLGVRDADFVTGFRAGINSASTWNREEPYKPQRRLGQGRTCSERKRMQFVLDWYSHRIL
ncbi:hypothetical protein BT96DRAFT_129762 [Gymnopus androsaceus JB14]|uniref:beta-glucosidase n=1 Tax=Gymnopus androsaceus JB14 TaxID=1447944 RepID=A0A6A4I9P9_9AGAR|nr:hypothetical protein BT96DRAFT_129762 [Gymnopus androsaceus JB14]